jgi:hypothetical protein
MPTLAAKIAVAAAATVLAWAGIEAVRLRHGTAAPAPRPEVEPDDPRTNEVPRLVNRADQAAPDSSRFFEAERFGNFGARRLSESP